MKKRCKAICKSSNNKGRQCTMDAIYGDYCSVHFFIKKGLKIKRRKV